jgi:hypothetical protein
MAEPSESSLSTKTNPQCSTLGVQVVQANKSFGRPGSLDRRYLNSLTAALFQWNPAPEAGLITRFMTWIEDYAMSTRRKDYRQYAFDCLRLADKVKDRAEREILLEMADAWTVIAPPGSFAY